MTFSSILDVLLVASVLHGIFLALALQLLHERNKAANKILSAILLSVTLMLLGRVVLFRFTSTAIWYAAIVADTTIFLFGPLVYLYIRRLLYRESPSYTLSKIHYLPAVIHLLFSAWYILMPLASLKALYENSVMTSIHFLFELIGIVSLGYYLFKTYLLHRNYNADVKDNVSNFQSALHFITVFIWVLIVVLCCWVISFANTIVGIITSPLLQYNSIWIVLSVFIYVVGYYSLRQPEVFRVRIEKDQAAAKDRLSPEAIRQLQKRLVYFMKEEEVYLQPDLTLKELSEKLHTTTNNLSWLLNNVYKSTFYDYVNGFRIEKFIALVSSGAHQEMTILGVALNAGFNSKSTFNRAFKAKTGSTPSSYLKQENSA